MLQSGWVKFTGATQHKSFDRGKENISACTNDET